MWRQTSNGFPPKNRLHRRRKGNHHKDRKPSFNYLRNVAMRCSRFVNGCVSDIRRSLHKRIRRAMRTTTTMKRIKRMRMKRIAIAIATVNYRLCVVCCVTRMAYGRQSRKHRGMPSIASLLNSNDCFARFRRSLTAISTLPTRTLQISLV